MTTNLIRLAAWHQSLSRANLHVGSLPHARLAASVSGTVTDGPCLYKSPWAHLSEPVNDVRSSMLRCTRRVEKRTGPEACRHGRAAAGRLLFGRAKFVIPTTLGFASLR